MGVHRDTFKCTGTEIHTVVHGDVFAEIGTEVCVCLEMHFHL